MTGGCFEAINRCRSFTDALNAVKGKEGWRDLGKEGEIELSSKHRDYLSSSCHDNNILLMCPCSSGLVYICLGRVRTDDGDYIAGGFIEDYFTF